MSVGMKQARDLRPDEWLSRSSEFWQVLSVTEVDPKPISMPYMRLRARDQRGEVHDFTLPSSEDVVVADV